MPEESVLALVTDIVSAHVSHNVVSVEQLPELIRAVHDALEGLGKAPPATETKREPAVPLRSSVKPDSVACLECGARMKMLKRHLKADHNLGPAEYRARWSLGKDYPLVAPEYAARRKDLAVKIGLGRKPEPQAAPPPAAAPAKAPRKARKPKA